MHISFTYICIWHSTMAHHYYTVIWVPDDLIGWIFYSVTDCVVGIVLSHRPNITRSVPTTAISPLQVSHRPNITRSSLTMNLTRADHGMELICRAKNPLLEEIVDTKYKLDVACKSHWHWHFILGLESEYVRFWNGVYIKHRINVAYFCIVIYNYIL